LSDRARPSQSIKTSKVYWADMILFEVAAFPAGDAVAELTTLIDTVRPLLLKLSLIAGGVLGLYILLLVMRVHYERKKVKVLQAIQYDLDQLNIHYGIPHSSQRKGFFQRAWASWFTSAEKGEDISPKPTKENRVKKNQEK